EITALLGGSLFIETIYGYPGMGRLSLESISIRDFSVANVLILMYGMLAIIGTLLSDIILSIVDPRIRIKKGGVNLDNEREDKNRLKEKEAETYKYNEEQANKEYTPPEKGDAFSLDDKDSSERKEMDMSVKADLPHGSVGHGALDMKNLPRSKPGWKIIFEELISDKLALFSLIILV